jgi:hypothetical protein
LLCLRCNWDLPHRVFIFTYLFKKIKKNKTTKNNNENKNEPPKEINLYLGLCRDLTVFLTLNTNVCYSNFRLCWNVLDGTITYQRSVVFCGHCVFCLNQHHDNKRNIIESGVKESKSDFTPSLIELNDV